MTVDPELKKFGEYVLKLRKARSLSQAKLAELAGLHRNYIGGIERGERNVALLNSIRLSLGFGSITERLAEEN